MKTIRKAAAVIAAILMISTGAASASALEMKEKDGVTYAYTDSGELYSGFTKKAGKIYYYKDGVKLKNVWLRSKKGTMLLLKDGSAAVGKVTVAGVEYEFDEKGWLMKDSWGVDVKVDDLNAYGLSLTVSVDGDMTVEVGNDYSVEKYTSEGWVAVTPKKYMAIVDIAHIITSEKSKTFYINTEESFGILDKGRYRVKKTIFSDGEDGKSVSKDYYGYFTVKYPAVKPLDDGAKSKLLKDFAKFAADDFKGIKAEQLAVTHYYGTYNGCEVAIIYPELAPVTLDMKQITVAGYNIPVGSGCFNIYVHKGSDFIELSEAYEQGLLSQKDIAAICWFA